MTSLTPPPPSLFESTSRTATALRTADTETAVRQVVETAAAVYSVVPAALTGPARHAPLVEPRFVAMGVLRWAAEMTFSEIGRHFDRAHPSIMYAVAEMQKWLVSEKPGIQASYDQVCEAAEASLNAAGLTLYPS